MNLSQNFTLDEFIRSGTALRHGLDNTPTQLAIINAEALCDNILEPVRAHFARPISILSGYRSPSLNAIAGGAVDSQHMKGEAADIYVHKVPHHEVTAFIMDYLEFDQLIAEHCRESNPFAGWIHVSFSLSTLRHEVLSCIKVGKYLSGIHKGA